jgi:hypothetical protein
MRLDTHMLGPSDRMILTNSINQCFRGVQNLGMSVNWPRILAIHVWR